MNEGVKSDSSQPHKYVLKRVGKKKRQCAQNCINQLLVFCQEPFV